MIKKIIFSIFIFLGILPIIAKASNSSLIKIGQKYYETFEEALENAGSNDTITLLSNIELKETQIINKTINIDLNKNNIEAPEIVFLVQGGTLNIKGEGIIREAKPNYGAIMIKGSSNEQDKNYSIVNIGKNVTLEGWSGIFITHDNNKSYGINVNFSGKINAVNDQNGDTGTGVYVNGNLKEKTNSPILNIKDGALINSTGNGLYFAGYGTYNITKAEISGVEAGIGIKSGILNIDGATIKGTGKDMTPTTGFNNGIKASGTTIQIESNEGYKGDIELNIDSGTFISENSHTIYEYIGKGNNSQVIALDISGGTFQSAKNKDNILISDSLKTFHKKFISGGTYSENPQEYLKDGYSIEESNNKYIVIQTTAKEVLGNNITKQNNNNKSIIFIITILIVLITLIYINKNQILKFLTK